MMLGALGAFGIGYVLGARAGKERYEQIRVWAGQAARRLETYGSAGSPAAGRQERDVGPV
ncbi:MAG TPA: hypothetical protein VFO49_16410 [Nocardioides sp.]|nr:hypothetical protein [Nocardioides sp.]